MSDALENIRVLGLALVAQEQAVGKLEVVLKRAKKRLLELQTEDLPMAMEEVGMTMIELADGSRITVKEDIICGITEARRAAAHAWLNEHGFGGLIKIKVTTDFGVGEAEEAELLAAELGERWQERHTAMDERVHPATLKSFIKEQLAAAAPLPLDLFGVEVFDRAAYTPSPK